jgi:microcystin-dependent protein
MARDGSGNYLLPSGNPVVSGTTITSTHFNTTLNDVAAALTGSLPRNGEASMTGPFRLSDGSPSTPAFGFNAEASTGLFRPTTNTLAFSVGGSERLRIAGGNIIIGSTSDGGQKLQVTGTASITGNTTVGGTFAVTGNTALTGDLAITGTTTGVTKAMVGLGNVDNTTDVGKPISTAVQAALDALVAARRGTISAVPFSSTPTGSLLCNGQAVNRTTYASLFALIGTSYGSGDGSTTFNVPDLRGVTLRGLDESRGLDPSRGLGTYQADAYASHAHGVNDPTHAHGVYDPGHGHSGVTDTQGYHGHSFTRPNLSGLGAGSAGFIGNIPNALEGAGTDGAGSHAHNVTVYASGTGIGIYGAGTGISIQANGTTETRMKNVAIRYVIWF